MAISKEKLTQFQNDVSYYLECGHSRASAFRNASRFIGNAVREELNRRWMEGLKPEDIRQVIFNEMER